MPGESGCRWFGVNAAGNALSHLHPRELPAWCRRQRTLRALAAAARRNPNMRKRVDSANIGDTGRKERRPHRTSARAVGVHVRSNSVDEAWKKNAPKANLRARREAWNAFAVP